MNKLYNLFLCFILFGSGKTQAQIIDTLINVGNHHLHFKIMQGDGLPILFESGNGDDGNVWESILQPIHKATGTTLITYDRAGLGQSEIDTTSISFEQEMRDLKSALEKLGIKDDLFVVCHSFGGFYTALFANQNKNRVKGAVFIDAALPCFFTQEWAKSFVNSIGQGDWEAIKTYKLGLYYVLQNLESISAYMSDKSIPQEIPITLIAAEKILPMVKADEIDSWKECLRAFGSQANHKYVLAKGAGHKVWADNPQVVIDEVTKLYKNILKMDR